MPIEKFLLVFGAVALGSMSLSAQDYQPKIAGASREGQLAIEGFRIPEGMTAKLVAAEPDLANPVAFCIDARGRFYICETFRQQKGVEDNRSHMNWLHDDLAAQTVEDRLAYFKKHLKEKVNDYALEHDRIRLLEDTTGDGKIDKSTVFADGFKDILTGTGAGVLAYRGDVFYTCIPDLWLLKDTDHDSKSDQRKSLATGFGVRVAFRGHDMHGLTIGPDGRLYFSIGDRGFNVITKEGERLVYPDTGAVLRCELDGSNLEVFASGLRNPQELAFDDFGNLFTGDNNSDSGDQARWVYVVQGGDSGWRMYFQYLSDRGPWNRERMWYPYQSDEETASLQPAFIVPPVANISDGPSGLTYYPGVGLPERYNGHFFLCDFRGNAGNSGIRSFAVNEKGAGFELVDSHEFLWSILATDADFGYDGGLYVTDWVEGWDGPGKGRLYRFADPKGEKAVADANVAQLFRDGFDQRDVGELLELLEHADKRVRQEAQFALVRKQAIDALTGLARQAEKPLSRRHAVWGLGQLIRQGRPQLASELSQLLSQDGVDPETRAQAAKVLGDCLRINKEAFGDCLKKGGCARMWQLLDDPHPRVRFFAAMAMANIGGPAEIDRLLKVLDENQDQDPWLHHAAVMGLAGIGERHPQELLKHAGHSSRFGRMGVLLALRRLASPEIVRFLDDVEPALVLEAARAVNDLPIASANEKLASLANRPGMPDALVRRVINANFIVGNHASAENLAKLAATADLAEALRLEAISALAAWNDPSHVDRVTGRWRPIDPRPADAVRPALRNHLAGFFVGSNAVREAGTKLAAEYGIREVVPVLEKLVDDKSNEPTTRLAALVALADLESKRLPEFIENSLKSESPLLRAQARRLHAKRNPKRAIPLLNHALAKGETYERQQALDVLSTIKHDDANRVLGEWLVRLAQDDVPLEIQWDLIEAAKKRGPALARPLERIEGLMPMVPSNDPEQYRMALAGGDPEQGREIFFGRSEVSCRRCHIVDGSGGQVGPDLSDIGLKQKPDYLLESIVDPNKKIAKGFESVLVATSDGQVLHGVFRSEDDKTLRLMNKDGGLILIPKEDIEDRAVGKSGMPSDLVKYLSFSDVRDLVAYLKTLKTPPQKAKSEHKE